MNAYSLADNSSKLAILTNAFNFAGLVLDTLGGCMAYVVTVKLQVLEKRLAAQSLLLSSLVESIEDSENSQKPDTKAEKPNTKAENVEELLKIFQVLEKAAPFILDNDTWIIFDRCLDQLSSILKPDSQMLRNTIDYREAILKLHRSGVKIKKLFYFTMIIYVIVSYGILSFVGGLICYVIHAQPLAVWTVSVGIAGILVVMYAAFMI